MDDVYAAIRQNYNQLSMVQKGIADYVIQNREKVIYQSITDLAETCCTSETTIMRFLRKIGYTSYQVFRVQVAQSSRSPSPKYAYSEIQDTDSISEIKEKIVASTQTAIEDVKKLISDDDISRVVEAICGARRIIVIGVGSSAYVAGDLYHKLIRLGLNAVFCDDPHIMAIHCAQATKDDVLICVSHSGESEIVLDCADIFRQQGGPLISITSYRKSGLAKMSDECLFSCTNETTYRPDAMTSRIIQMVIIDLITVVLTLKLGERGLDAVSKSQVAVARQKK